MKWTIYRDCDARFRLRKIVAECWDKDGSLIMRKRFMGCFFMKARRRAMERQIARMRAFLKA